MILTVKQVPLFGGYNEGFVLTVNDGNFNSDFFPNQCPLKCAVTRNSPIICLKVKKKKKKNGMMAS